VGKGNSVFPSPGVAVSKRKVRAVKNLFEIAKDSGYPIDAFLFVQRGLDHTVRWLHGEEEPVELDVINNEDDEDTQSRHVSGQQLCLGLREFAVTQYGLMARTVLKRWNIRSSRDFGAIVFHMVEAGLMHKTDEDSIQDFINVFRFEEAFPSKLSLEPGKSLKDKTKAKA